MDGLETLPEGIYPTPTLPDPKSTLYVPIRPISQISENTKNPNSAVIMTWTPLKGAPDGPVMKCEGSTDECLFQAVLTSEPPLEPGAGTPGTSAEDVQGCTEYL